MTTVGQKQSGFIRGTSPFLSQGIQRGRALTLIEERVVQRGAVDVPVPKPDDYDCKRNHARHLTHNQELQTSDSRLPMRRSGVPDRESRIPAAPSSLQIPSTFDIRTLPEYRSVKFCSKFSN
jgi:hypothetical protein